ncbi:MAG: hypothetical protein ACM3ZE_01355 [Myxococcales bacterium]
MARVSASFSGLMSHRERRTYDHRIRAQIIAASDPALFPELGILLSTAVSWIHRGAGARDYV